MATIVATRSGDPPTPDVSSTKSETLASRGELPDTEPVWQGRGRYGRQNLAVAAAHGAGWALLLTALDQPWPLWLRLPLLVLFCLMMQGVFSMMHEFFHGHAHRSRRLNRAIGLWESTLFGTSATLYQVNHWGHHVRNRSEAERVDFLHPGESPAGKVALYYAAILGGIWLSSALFSLAVVAVPHRAARALSRAARTNGYSAAFAEFSPDAWRRMRLESAALWLFWGGVLLFSGWQWTTLALAYGAFAFSWSSLQWIYHLRTPLDPIEGAYDLRAPALVRWLFLDFNHNLTHHRHPGLPWQELRAASDPRETQPLWYRYLLVFRPPVPLPEDPSCLAKTYF